MRLDQKTRKHQFQPGRYYIGDPCYVVADKDWDTLIDETGCFGIEGYEATGFWDDGLFKYNGKVCFANGTAWGDGEYDAEGTSVSLGVDAGLISIMPIECIGENEMPDTVRLGVVVEFKDAFNAYYEDGVFHFGHIVVDTN